MQLFNSPIKNSKIILALGAESAGNFSVFENGTIYFSQDFADLLENANFDKYKRELNNFLKKEKIKPDVILSDLHPEFVTTQLAKELTRKYKAPLIQVQHHIAHVFSSIGDEIINDPEKLKSYSLKSCVGIACDGTGFAEDGTVWGGEIFKISNLKFPIYNKFSNSKLNIERIAHLENQVLLGGELAIKEPARVLISILSKFLDKKEIYKHIKKHYSKNEFELLWNQLQQEFNCIETSSTARVLDAVSLLLGFAKNKRAYKHEPVDLLAKNSTKPCNLKPKLENYKLQISNSKQTSNSKIQIANEMLVLNTTHLFEYLINNLHEDKKRLAATAQKYIADGLFQIIQNTKYDIQNTCFAGGMANNKIISSLLESKGVYISKKIPRGDAGISFGQLTYYLLTDSGD